MEGGGRDRLEEKEGLPSDSSAHRASSRATGQHEHKVSREFGAEGKNRPVADARYSWHEWHPSVGKV